MWRGIGCEIELGKRRVLDEMEDGFSYEGSVGDAREDSLSLVGSWGHAIRMRGFKVSDEGEAERVEPTRALVKI